MGELLTKAKAWKRFIDDCLDLEKLPEEQLEEFLTMMNSLDQNIKLTFRVDFATRSVRFF